MYVPSHFEMSAHEAAEVADRVGIGHLVTMSGARFDSTLIPFVIDHRDDSLVVRAHLAAANPQKREVEAGATALLIVHAADSYVSPALYPTKTEHGKVVPTWNYVLVHLHGVLRPIDDRHRLLSLVTQLTVLHESRRETPWSVDDAPEDYIDKQLKAIVGLELQVDLIEGKAKLSQNRSEQDRSAVRTALLEGDERQRAVGTMMQ